MRSIVVDGWSWQQLWLGKCPLFSGNLFCSSPDTERDKTGTVKNETRTGAFETGVDP